VPGLNETHLAVGAVERAERTVDPIAGIAEDMARPTVWDMELLAG
jgi:hypothetical protein